MFLLVLVCLLPLSGDTLDPLALPRADAHTGGRQPGSQVTQGRSCRSLQDVVHWEGGVVTPVLGRRDSSQRGHKVSVVLTSGIVLHRRGLQLWRDPALAGSGRHHRLKDEAVSDLPQVGPVDEPVHGEDD